MRMTEIRVIPQVLRTQIGSRWPLVLTQCVKKRRAIINQTQWAGERTKEARFVNRLGLVAGIYSVLSNWLGKEEAFRTVSRITVPIGVCEQWHNLKSLELAGKRGMDRLMAFYEFMGRDGSGQFVKRAMTQRSDELLEFEVRDCLFVRFFREIGMIELATLFCKVDKAFFPTAIPEYEFSRGDSFENTCAYGKEHCLFRFKRKTYLVDEVYLGETPLLDFTHPRIQMAYERLDLVYDTDQTKLGRFYEYVEREIEVVGENPVAKSASQVLKKGRGGRNFKTTLFMALLRAAAIPCRAYLVPARDGMVLCAEVFYDGAWSRPKPWSSHGASASVGPSEWDAMNGGLSGKSAAEAARTYESPDAFFSERKRGKGLGS